MALIKRKKRRKEPSKVVSNHFAASVKRMAADFLESDSFNHALTKGEEREDPIKSFFINLIPKTFNVVSGEVIDLNDNSGPQLDLMIYDQIRNFGFYSKGKSILPSEALIVSIEIKSKLTIGELRKSVKASKKLHKMQPFKESLSHPRLGGEQFDGKCRYFHCIFAYESTISSNDKWLQKEYKRYEKVTKELKTNLGIIERIYVANKGMINPRKNWGLTENNGSGKALMHFYLDILNFLIKENDRRKTAPYIAYIGQIGKTNWEKLK